MKGIKPALGALIAAVGVTIFLTTVYPGYRQPREPRDNPKPAGYDEQGLEKTKDASMQLSHRVVPGADSKALEQANALNPGDRNAEAKREMPRPAGDDEEEIEKRREGFIQLRHRAAPGVNWKAIERENALNTLASMKTAERDSRTSFAGGKLYGTWYERGNSNQAGIAQANAYWASANILFSLSGGQGYGGHLWRTPLPTASWTLANDQYQFDPQVLEVAAQGSGTGCRVFTTTFTTLRYSDNNGSTFTAATGISFPNSGDYRNRICKIIATTDGLRRDVYALINCWENSAERVHLYWSTNNGQSFTLLKKYPAYDQNRLSLSRPYNDANVYMLGITASANDTLYKVYRGTISTLSNTSTFPSNHDRTRMVTQVTNSTVYYYAYTAGPNLDPKLYYSSNNGSTWTLKSTLGPQNYPLQLGVSVSNSSKVLYGNTEAYRSTDNGATFTRINYWWEYYGNESTKLHADIRDIFFSKYSNGTEFGIISTDGGIYLTTDQGATVANKSLSGHNINMYWDHKTHPDSTNIVFGGTQDQGIQTTITARGTGLFTSHQIISGDDGQMRITRLNGDGIANTLWTMYCNGILYLHRDLTVYDEPYEVGQYSIPGTQVPNNDWLPPTANYFSDAKGEYILVGGGNTSGGSGSYLIKLNVSSGGSITATQYSQDFRDQTTGARGISAIAVSKLSSSYIYVATEDGRFFYSSNAGSSWTQTSSFVPQGDWLYGASIVPASDSLGKVYLGGSGYSNPAVYVSRNHGYTFTSMSNGLPSTLVNRLAAYKNDSFLFAATEAGPYVYVKQTNQWYSLMATGVPIVDFESVEYIQSINTVRFGTWGRGIWDLKITAADGQRVVQGRTGNNSLPKPEIKLYPNPVKAGQFLEIESDVDHAMTVDIYDMSGRLIMSQADIKGGIQTGSLPAGTYVCRITIEGYMPQDKQFMVQ
jgi:hypothetical protein